MATYNSDWTGYQIDEAIKKVRNSSQAWDNKQNKVTGTVDQIVGFNAFGDMVAKDIGTGDIATVPWTKEYVNEKNKTLKEYVDSLFGEEEDVGKSAKNVTITLPAKNWQNKTQTIYINGISENEEEQLINPVVKSSDFYAYANAEIHVTQSLNELTFTCVETPFQDITMYVVIQELVQIKGE